MEDLEGELQLCWNRNSPQVKNQLTVKFVCDSHHQGDGWVSLFPTPTFSCHQWENKLLCDPSNGLGMEVFQAGVPC